MVMQEYTVTDEQAAEFGLQMFWIGLTTGFLGCILLSNLLGWYS